MRLLAAAVAASTLTACVPLVIIDVPLGGDLESTTTSGAIKVVDNRPTKSIDLRGLVVDPREMHEIRPTPTVSQAIQSSLARALPGLNPDDAVEVTVLEVSCRIANNYTVGSVTFTLKVEGQFRKQGTFTTKTLMAGYAEKDLPLGFKGLDYATLCPGYFRRALAEIGQQAHDHLLRLR